MNHLAHTVLAGDDPHMIVGGLLGDFWRGAPDPAWPEGLRAGVMLHRAIDSFTDAHPVTVAARARFEPPFRRYAGIILDVWFDHLLARDFERCTRKDLASFTEGVYTILREDDARWPLPFRLFATRLAQYDGLGAYAQRGHIGFVFERIGERLARANPMALALPAVEAVESGLARDFEALWPDLVSHAAAFRT